MQVCNQILVYIIFLSENLTLDLSRVTASQWGLTNSLAYCAFKRIIIGAGNGHF